MQIDLNKTNGSSPPLNPSPVARRKNSARSAPRTKPQEILKLWSKYFPDISLTETRWFETEHIALLEDAFQIAAKKDRTEFEAFDEENIGKYIKGVLRKLKRSSTVRNDGKDFLVSTKVWFQADYKITEEDRTRFKSRLVPSGDCLLYDGGRSTGEYARFRVAGRTVYAHVFAYFSEVGYLPRSRGLGGSNGLQVAHQCRQRTCCNASHLRLTTKAVNLLQRVFSCTVGTFKKVASSIDYGSTHGRSLSNETQQHCEVPNRANTSLETIPTKCSKPTISAASHALPGIKSSRDTLEATELDKSRKAAEGIQI
jgi:hypothetical protein